MTSELEIGSCFTLTLTAERQLTEGEKNTSKNQKMTLLGYSDSDHIDASCNSIGVNDVALKFDKN